MLAFASPAAVLTLADSSAWGIAAGNTAANGIVSRFMKIMQLQDAHCETAHLSVLGVSRDARPGQAAKKRLGSVSEIPAEYISFGQNSLLPVSIFFHEHGVICELQPDVDNSFFNLQLIQLSQVMARHIQARGGLLLHGALAELNGSGVILAGPGGTGKTTASNRLPATWNSLCDDNTLVVCDADGKYWAHPWPTWSRFLDGDQGDTWNVEYAVPLAGMFFLSQAEADEVLPIGAGQATALLVASAEQASRLVPHTTKEQLRAYRCESFENISSLAQSVPSHILKLSLTGTFWQEIESTIGMHGKDMP